MMKKSRLNQLSAMLAIPLLLTLCLPLGGQTNSTAPREIRVLLMGDSIMIQLARSIERELAGRPGYKVTSFPSLGTGLARLDLFDWLKKTEELTQDGLTDFLVVMIGANDRQAMRTGATTILQPSDSAAWSAEYARRVGKAMDIMIKNKVKHVLWMELPDMRDPKTQNDVLQINAIFKQEAAARPGVAFVPCKQLLSRKPGTYSSYIMQSSGMPLTVRYDDGVHLNRAGADLLGNFIVAQMTNTTTLR